MFSINPPEAGSEILAVCLTYRPSEAFPSYVEKIRKQVGGIVIVDDGANEADKKRLRNWFAEDSDIILYHLKNNDGIPLSLNIGFEIAKKKGYLWAMVFDDDTIVYPDMVERLLTNLKSIKNGKPIAMSAMSWTEIGHCSQKNVVKSLPAWMEKRAVIGSGCLYSLKAHDVIGPFPDNYFLGCTDYEYCLRARAKGFRIIRFSEIGFQQRLGKPSIRRWGPFSFKIYNYSAPRYYYEFRNNLMNIRANWFRDPFYVAAVLFYLLKRFLIVGLFEKDGRQKNRLMLMGFWHGIIKRMGKTIPDE